jgi:hypothetical protein
MIGRPLRVPLLHGASFGLTKSSTIGLFRQASPAVVNITAIGVQRDLLPVGQPRNTTSVTALHRIFTRYRKEPAPDLSRIPKATSSPIFHVIQNAAAAQVTLGDQSIGRRRLSALLLIRI